MSVPTTTQNYLAALTDAKNKLAENLNGRNVTASADETIESLVSKVTLVNGGIERGTWTPLTTTDILTLSGIKLIPAKISLCCDYVMKNRIAGIGVNNVAMFNAEIDVASGSGKTISIELLKAQSGTINFSSSETAEAVISWEKASDDTYTVAISFNSYNTANPSSVIKFRTAANYSWIIAETGWNN